MRNYARFHNKIDVSRAILVIKDLTCLVRNSSKASMKNDMLDFDVIKLFGINTRIGKVLCPLHVRCTGAEKQNECGYFTFIRAAI